MKKRNKSIKKGGSNNWSSSNSNNNRMKKRIPSKPKVRPLFKGKNDIAFIKIGDERLCKIEKEDDKRVYFVCNMKIIEKKLKFHENSSNKEKIIVGELELNIKESSKEIRGKAKEILNKFKMINTLSNVKDEFIANIIQLLWDESFGKKTENNIVKFEINQHKSYNPETGLLLNIGNHRDGEKWSFEFI